MDPARHPREKKKDRTGMWISIGVHVGALGIVLLILTTTKMGQELLRGGLEALRGEKKPPPVKAPPPKGPPKAAPKVSQDAPPPASSGPRRVTDAPPAVGEGLAVDTGKGKVTSTGGSGGRTNV